MFEDKYGVSLKTRKNKWFFRAALLSSAASSRAVWSEGV